MGTTLRIIITLLLLSGVSSAGTIYDTLRPTGGDYNSLDDFLLAADNVSTNDTLVLVIGDYPWGAEDAVSANNIDNRTIGDGGLVLIRHEGGDYHTSGIWKDAAGADSHYVALVAGNILDFEEGPYKFDGVQFKSYATDGYIYIGSNGPPDLVDSLVFDNCIFNWTQDILEGYNTTYSTHFYFRNCVFFDTSYQDAATDPVFYVPDNMDKDSIWVFNSVFHGVSGICNAKGLGTDAPEMFFVNCVFDSIGDMWRYDQSAFEASADSNVFVNYCTFSDTSTGFFSFVIGPDTNFQNCTFQQRSNLGFVDGVGPAANAFDFHIDGTGSATTDAGTDSEDFMILGKLTTDVDGTTRTNTWDIGIDDYVTVSAATRRRHLLLRSGRKF